jgi:hypothetical protein
MLPQTTLIQLKISNIQLDKQFEQKLIAAVNEDIQT